jgi:hypothetical protein
VVYVLDDKGKKTGKQRQIFPRFHQLTCVRELGADAQKHGAGRRYLNQHSAGSGKTNCIAWLANSLATLHTPDGKPVFNSVIVISDRRLTKDNRRAVPLSNLPQHLNLRVQRDHSHARPEGGRPPPHQRDTTTCVDARPCMFCGNKGVAALGVGDGHRPGRKGWGGGENASDRTSAIACDDDRHSIGDIVDGSSGGNCSASDVKER